MTVPSRVDLVIEVGADLLIELASNPLQQLVEQANGQSSALALALAQYAQAADAAWREAFRIAGSHVALVVQNNPRKTAAEILARPDIQQVLQIPFQRAAVVTENAIRSAWDEGVRRGLADANDDLRMIGLDGVPGGPLDTSMLDRLISDTYRNAGLAGDELRSRISGQQAITRTHYVMSGESWGRRAQYGVEAAGKHAQAAVKEQAYAQLAADTGIEIWKVWVTRFGPGTCVTCARLHGSRKRLGEPFSATARFGTGKALRVYGGDLGHPPRHPNCQCRIVPWVGEMSRAQGATLASMKRFAENWWDNPSLRR